MRPGSGTVTFCFLFSSAMQIKEGQFVQNEAGSVCIRVVPRTDYGSANQACIMEAARQKFGNHVDVTIQVVDAIPRTASGKFLEVVTNLRHDILERSEELDA